MFDRRSKLLSAVTLLQDLGVTCVAFVVAYWLGIFLVHYEFFSAQLPGIYPFTHYLPLLIALIRGKRDILAIGLLNFFLGWTLIGWVVALIWAVKTDVVVVYRPQ